VTVTWVTCQSHCRTCRGMTHDALQLLETAWLSTHHECLHRYPTYSVRQANPCDLCRLVCGRSFA